MVDPSRLRVADADRERVAGELREHLVAGRLTLPPAARNAWRLFGRNPDAEAVEADLARRRRVECDRRHSGRRVGPQELDR